MKYKIFMLTAMLYFFSTVSTSAHEIGAVENTNQSISIWVYAISTLFLIGLVGYAYALYLKKKLTKEGIANKQKEIRRIKQEIDKKRRQTLKISTAFIAIGLIASIIWAISQPEQGGIEILKSNVAIDVETFESEGRDHIRIGDATPSYETFPPTSGPHSPQWGEYGYYEKPLPFELLVHNLEHGDIVIYYQPTLDEETKEHLKNLSTFTKIGSGVIIVPNDEIQGEVVATAWTKRMVLSSFDEEKVGKFIYDYIYKGPEKLPPRN
jgi:hypothetical protein